MITHAVFSVSIQGNQDHWIQQGKYLGRSGRQAFLKNSALDTNARECSVIRVFKVTILLLLYISLPVSASPHTSLLVYKINTTEWCEESLKVFLIFNLRWLDDFTINHKMHVGIYLIFNSSYNFGMSVTRIAYRDAGDKVEIFFPWRPVHKNSFCSFNFKHQGWRRSLCEMIKEKLPVCKHLICWKLSGHYLNVIQRESLKTYRPEYSHNISNW